jgi:hypothetical protein
MGPQAANVAATAVPTASADMKLLSVHDLFMISDSLFEERLRNSKVSKSQATVRFSSPLLSASPTGEGTVTDQEGGDLNNIAQFA